MRAPRRAVIACLLVTVAVASAAAEERRITLPADSDYGKLAPGPSARAA